VDHAAFHDRLGAKGEKTDLAAGRPALLFYLRYKTRGIQRTFQ
jgi:hypothetical protein